MKLKVGNYYNNRAGEVIHIVEYEKYGTDHPYSDEEGNTYMSDGAYGEKWDRHDLDIVGVQF